MFVKLLITKTGDAYRRALLRLVKRSLESQIDWKRFDEDLSRKLDCLAVLLER
jgi:hypothetical protein